MQNKIMMIFAKKGALLWLLVGGLVAIIGFEPTMSIDYIKANPTLYDVYSSAWWHTALKVVVVWGLLGAVMGIIIFFFFKTRPMYLHRTSAPGLENMPDFPGIRKAKNMAEIATTPFALLFGFFLGFIAYIFLLPFLFNSNIIMARQSWVAAGISGLQAGLMSVMILPSSLKKLEKMIR